MQYISHTTWLAGAASAAEKQGPGTLLRTLLAVLLVGAALMAWFLLRGYRSDGPADDGVTKRSSGADPSGNDRPSGADPSSGAERSPDAEHSSGGDGTDTGGDSGRPGAAGAGTAAGRTSHQAGDAGQKP